MQKTSRRGTTRRTIAAVAAAALAMVGVLAAAAPASAAPGNMPTGDGTLTIHKFEQPATSGAANDSGAPLSSATTSSWVALSGVKFTVQRITTVDLQTNAGWDAASGYATSPSTIPAGSLGAASTVTTGASGAVSRTLPIGAYLVTEVASPDAKLPDGSPAHITMTAAPFVVTVPIPTTAGTWNTDVHVYPKNSLSAVAKSVAAPSGLGLGATLTWTIDVKIPFLTAGDSFSDFDVTDVLDAKLQYVAGSATASVAGTSVAVTDTTSGQNVALSPALGALAAHQGKTISFSFSTTVIAAGSVVNQASAFINDPNHTNGITSNQATTYWGSILITKHAEGDAAKTLEGAVFGVYTSEADALADTNRVSVNGEDEFRTGVDGTVLIPGLFVSNTPGQTKVYYVHELTAPAGYDLNETAFAVTLTADGQVATPVAQSVADPQKPAFELPITGGDGARTMLFLGGGLLLVALGVAIVAMRRRSAQR